MNRSNVEFHAKLQLVCQFVRRNEKALQDSSSRLTHSWLIYIDNNLLWTKYNIKDKNEMFNCGVVMLNQLVRIVPMQVADFFSVAHLQRGTPRSLVDKVSAYKDQRVDQDVVPIFLVLCINH